MWADVRDRLVDAARRPDSQLRTRLGEALASAGARLAEDGAKFYAAANVVASVVAGLGAVFAGVAVAEALWS